MESSSSSALFRPIKLGASQLQHRVVLAPMSRLRSDDRHVPSALHAMYYAQRATMGGLLIAEGALISDKLNGWPGAPGIYSDDQIAAWQAVTEAVHRKGGVIFLQIFHMGRLSDASFNGGDTPVGPSPVAAHGNHFLTGRPAQVPRALDQDEIHAITRDHVQAAKNAIRAGFDGVELHGANGSLLDQFLNAGSNNRSDQYGGTVENRARLLLETVRDVANAIGEQHVGVRLSPFGQLNGMGDGDPYTTYGHVVTHLREHHPALAYLHLIEARDDDVHGQHPPPSPCGPARASTPSLDHFRTLWGSDRPLISAGGYTTNLDLADKTAARTGTLVAFGRAFIANPDLPQRLRNHWPLNKYHRDTFYTSGPEGYTDYPFYTSQAF